MTLNSLSYEKKNLKKYFLGSIFLHVFFVLFFMKFNTVFYEIFNRAPKKTLIKEFVQVDLVGMPKLTKSELEKISPVINHKLPVVEKIDQVNDIIAQSLEDALVVTTQLVSQKITSRPILQICKAERKGGKTVYSCRSQYKMNFDAASRMHVQLMRDELNRKKAEDARKEYESFFKEGLYEKVRDDIGDSQE